MQSCSASIQIFIVITRWFGLSLGSVTNVYTAVFGSHYKIQAVRLGIKKTDSCIEAMRWRFHFFGSDCYIQAMRWRAQSYSEPIAIFRPCVGGCINVE